MVSDKPYYHYDTKVGYKLTPTHSELSRKLLKVIYDIDSLDVRGLRLVILELNLLGVFFLQLNP